jgi:hypothetical protein
VKVAIPATGDFVVVPVSDAPDTIDAATGAVDEVTRFPKASSILTTGCVDSVARDGVEAGGAVTRPSFAAGPTTLVEEKVTGGRPFEVAVISTAPGTVAKVAVTAAAPVLAEVAEVALSVAPVAAKATVTPGTSFPFASTSVTEITWLCPTVTVSARGTVADMLAGVPATTVMVFAGELTEPAEADTKVTPTGPIEVSRPLPSIVATLACDEVKVTGASMTSPAAFFTTALS